MMPSIIVRASKKGLPFLEKFPTYQASRKSISFFEGAPATVPAMDLSCQADGCALGAVGLVPDPQGWEGSLARLVHAPIRCFCTSHAELVSDRYAQVVAWALITCYSQGLAVELHLVQVLCDQLREMPTDLAQATHAILTRLKGIE